MKIFVIIGLIVTLLNGCNPHRKVDQNYKESYELVTDVLDECCKLVSDGRGDEVADVVRTDPWGTQIHVSVSHRSNEIILVAIAAGADGVHHTVDDVVETRKIQPDKNSTEQPPSNGE